MARAHRNRHAKFAEQAAERIEPRRPGLHPRRAYAMKRRDGLLRHRLDRHRMDLLVPGRFEQCFRIRAIGLVAADIPASLRGDAVRGAAAPAVVKEAGRHPGRLTGGAPRRAPAADGDAVAVEDQWAVGVAACPPPRQGLGNGL